MLRYYPPEKQGLRRIFDGTSANIWRLRYYPPEKQGLRQFFRRLSLRIPRPQILSSRKTRIKTSYGKGLKTTVGYLRYYPPEKQGLRPPSWRRMRRTFHSQILSSRKTRIKTKHELRLSFPDVVSQILSSRKTRIKTASIGVMLPCFRRLRYYPPEKQGLRLRQVYLFAGDIGDSDTILQKNKD